MPEFKVCPECNSRILVEGTPDICDECDVPYITEKAMAEKRVADEKSAKAKAEHKEAVAKAEAELDKAKAKLDEK